ncbi:hypothetical protein K432DRAFT_385196 [Lepidopterella palustris CBS 459.81]|uniref:Mediator of RNA polymerase II transcription subunit 6 n=1 Tax=Lepidopterella palustris CBS 459.81 TaxID=1314670 RepID=A0A8E2JBY1_9PEZI|nr:hypothetical protein K432DRAFT_385196 [Lepidopterella palustris CBS 459.81]
MAQSKIPLDETTWSDQNWLEYLGGIHTNSVHRYFYASSFFDPTSNNYVILQNATRFPEHHHLLNSRSAFEAAVRAMPSGGLQFMVTGEPETDDGVWVVQKQNRIVEGADLGERIEVLGTYWVVGERVFMAPSVAAVVGSKILCATTALTLFLKTASTLSLFTPSTGHTYFPHPTNLAKLSLPGSISRAASPASVMDASQTALPATAQPGTTSTTTSTTFDPKLFTSSLTLTARFASEFADENPLQGEPGSFVFSSTNERIAAQNAIKAAETLKAQAAALAAGEGGMGMGGSGLGLGLGRGGERERESVVSTAAPTPKPVDGIGDRGRKGSQGKGEPGKLKKKKSRAGGSP